MMLFVIILVLLVILIIIYYRNETKKYKDILKFPGPTTTELIRRLYFSKSDKINYLLSLNEKYGPVIKIRIWPFKPAIMTTEVSYIEKVMCSNHLYTPSFQLLRPYIRNGIATIESAELWKNDRKIISKALSKRYIESNWILYNNKSDLIVKQLYEKLGEPINLQLYFTKNILEITIESLADPQIMVTSEDIQEYVKYRSEFDEVYTKSIDSFMIGAFLKRNSIARTGKKLIQWAEKLLTRHLQVESSLRQKHNVIHGMIAGNMPSDRIVDNINTLIQAGHESTAITLAYMFYEMARHPSLQQKIIDEVISTIGTDTSVPISISDVQKMTYLHRFVCETLRLHFFLSIIDRRLNHDISIDNTRIPKGTNVMFPFTVIHTTEKYFPDPLKFDPDRFLPENLSPDMQMAFHGFGHGAKICPGLLIAHVLIKLIVAKIILEFEVHPIPVHHLGMVGELIIKSKTGIMVTFKKRTV